MKNIQDLKRMMQTNKMAFDYNFTMMLGAYEQNKLLLFTILNSSTETPPETRDAIDKWLQAYRNGCEEFKKTTDEGYKVVEEVIDTTMKKQP